MCDNLQTKLLRIIHLIVKYNLSNEKNIGRKEKNIKKVREHLIQCTIEERELILKIIEKLKILSEYDEKSGIFT